MYTRQELNAIDRSYFEVIIADEYEVTLMSRNTRHVWHLRNVPDGEVTVILHKHQDSDPYHVHGRSRTMKQAIRYIKKHDLFQMNGRKPVYKR